MKTAKRLAAALAAAIVLWSLGSKAVLAGGMCAEVQLEIEQTLTLERQGFDAMMRIHNGITTHALTNVNIQLTFRNGDGEDVSATSDASNTNAYFFYRLDSLEGISGVSDGRVGPGETAEIHWLIIPSIKAGGTNEDGVIYFIGAELEYWLNGDKEEVAVQPDYITVRPLPKLQLDYFLPGTVYGDDPWTDFIEETVPFPLGLRMKNDGAGPAWKLKIESAQPKITENRQGLLVGFNIVGADVNGTGREKTLTVDFGTLPPGETEVAKWMMTASLFGTFTNFTASYTHADDLGGELTSLIDSVATHHLVKDVRVDLAGRDRVYDFLADDEGNVKAYESDGIDLPVTDGSAAAELSSTDPYIWRLDTEGDGEAHYVKKGFAAATNGEMEVAYAIRDDGKKILGENIWLNRTRERGEQPWEGWFNLFDADGGGHSYLAVLSDLVAESNRPPTMQFIPTKVVEEGQHLEFLVEAVDADGTVPELAAYAMPEGATFTSAGEGTAWFAWEPGVGSRGVYPVRFTASDGEYETFRIVRIYVGAPGEARAESGVPESLAGWGVELSDLLGQTGFGTATARWDSAEGLMYDLYVSDDSCDGEMHWTLSRQDVEGTGEELEAEDEDFGTERVRRFYRLTLAGEDPTSENLWGILRQEIPAGTYALMSLPLQLADRSFAGRLGSALAEGLERSSNGPGTGGAEIYLFREDGGWELLYLDGEGIWRGVDGRESEAELQAGQGFWVSRPGSGTVKATFAGRVGNAGEGRLALQTGYNLIGLSEGRSVPLEAALSSAQPVGGLTLDAADCVMLPTGNGNWRTLMFVEGSGDERDGHWYDLNGQRLLESNETIEPGQAFYYLRRGGDTEISF